MIDDSSLSKDTEYIIYEIKLSENRQIEQMGSKRKFWFWEKNSKQTYLFKYNRPDTGEDWSEKIASEIAGLLNIPHAEIQLAECKVERGIITKNFTDNGKNTLVHGNELLGVVIPEYPLKQKFKLSKHSINNIINALSQYHLSVPIGTLSGIDSPIELFLGYLMLDVLIGNTDRHHENWGIILAKDKIELAPTFDHASSLGRELIEEDKGQKLSNVNLFNRYCNKARSAIFLSDSDVKALSTIEAFRKFAKSCTSKNLWLDKLRNISDDSLINCVRRVPSVIMSELSKGFAEKLLLTNKRRLLELL